MAGTALLFVAFDLSVPIVIVDEVLLLVLFKLCRPNRSFVQVMPPKLSIDAKLEQLDAFVRKHSSLLAGRKASTLQTCLCPKASADEKRWHRFLQQYKEKMTRSHKERILRIYAVLAEYSKQRPVSLTSGHNSQPAVSCFGQPKLPQLQINTTKFIDLTVEQDVQDVLETEPAFKSTTAESPAETQTPRLTFSLASPTKRRRTLYR